MGGHSGLSPLAAALNPYFEVKRLRPDRKDRLLSLARRGGAFLQRLTGKPPRRHWTPYYHRDHALMEAAAIRCAQRGDFDWIVIESLEDIYVRLDEARDTLPSRTRLMAISHQPPAWWKLYVSDVQALSRLDVVIALSNPARDYLDAALNKPAFFLNHGVDHAFFAPPPSRVLSPSDTVHILFCGQWLRDFDALERLVAKVNAAGIDAIFHLVVPAATREGDSRYRLAYHHNTKWYAGLSDEELLSLYRMCHFLVLPLIDATANNSLVEAMACALPILVSEVGGVPDYVDEEIATYLDRDTDRAVLTLQGAIADYPSFLRKAARGRDRICESLNWDQFAAGLRRIAAGGE
jgi:glycosyltransferase involved in cell wall biosynthesis